ncbi:MAG: TonB-dependent receptor plug domain-containing protein, partial [Pseudomonadota bacterium]
MATSSHFAQAAVAQDTDGTPDDVIVVTGRLSTFGATKSDIPILETARSVSVIDAKTFLEKGALTLDDTLAYTAGVVGDAFGFSTRGNFAKVRGLNAPEYLDNIQVLFGNFNNARSDIYTLEQVEVLKGPTSVLYGQGSPGGIINLISKKASLDYLDRELVLEYGTFDRLQSAVDLGFKINESGSFTGRFVGVYRDSGTQVDFVDDDAIVVAPSITYEDDATRLTLLYEYIDRKSGSAHQFLPLAATACPSGDVTITINDICAGGIERELDSSLFLGDPSFDRYNSSSHSVTAFAIRQLTDFLQFEATARFRDAEVDYRQSWIHIIGDGVTRINGNGDAKLRIWYKAPASSEQFAVDARFRANFETGPVTHELLVGASHQDVKTEELINAFLSIGGFNVFNPVYDGSQIPSLSDLSANSAPSKSS